jgi:hypothetical protein
MLPIAFDGHHFRIIGDVDCDENGTQVRDQRNSGRRYVQMIQVLVSVASLNRAMTFCKVGTGTGRRE